MKDLQKASIFHFYHGWTGKIITFTGIMVTLYGVSAMFMSSDILVNPELAPSPWKPLLFGAFLLIGVPTMILFGGLFRKQIPNNGFLKLDYVFSKNGVQIDGNVTVRCSVQHDQKCHGVTQHQWDICC